MKTLRELINLIESAQNPAKPIIAWVEPATCSTMSNDQYENNPFANETGDWKPIHTQEELAVWQDRREEKKRGQALGQNPVAEGIPNDLTPYEAGEADGLSGEPYENPYPEGSESYAEFRQGWRAGYSESKQEELEETKRKISEAHKAKTKGA